MHCKVIYSDRPELGGKLGGILVDVVPGELTVDSEGLSVAGERPISIPFAEIQAIRMFRHFGLCRMIEIIHVGGTLFVSPIRGIVFGAFAWVNFFKAGELFQILSHRIRQRNPPN